MGWQPKFSSVSWNNVSSGSTTRSQIVAASATRRTYALGFEAMSDAAANVSITSSTGATYWGPHYFAANGGMVNAWCPVGVCRSAVNRGLFLTQTTTANVTVDMRAAIGGTST